MDSATMGDVLGYILLGGLLLYAVFVALITYRRQMGKGSIRETKMVVIAGVLFINVVGGSFQIIAGSLYPICLIPFALASLLIALITWKHIEGAREQWLTWSVIYANAAAKMAKQVKSLIRRR